MVLLRAFIILLFIITLFIGSKVDVKAQYCTPDTFCVGSQSCDRDGWCSEFCINCPGGCNAATGACNPVFTISGNVYIDENGNGVRNFGEDGYDSGVARIVRLSDGDTDNTNFGGNYNFTNKVAGNYTVTLTVPTGYQATTTNPRNISLNGNTTVNFGIQLIPPPACTGGINATPSTVGAGETATVSVTSCDDVEDPNDGNPPPPYDWEPPDGTNPECSDGVNNDGVQGTDSADPDCHTNGDPTQPYNPWDDSESTPSNTCDDGGVGTPTNTSTSSTATYTAPACPTEQLTCPISIDVSGPGGTTTYNTNITVPATYNITTNIRLVSDTSGCTASSGSPYTESTVNVNLTGGSLPPGGVTQQTSTGSTIFACLENGNYLVTVAVPSGYSIIGRSGGTSSGTNGISFNNILSNQTANFCIAPIEPWFQTTTGDTRFVNINNPVPATRYASTDPTYPGVFYSSSGNAEFGFGAASVRNWVINDEYDYNAETENRNGGMSYDYYQSKARRDGVTITPISTGTFVQNEITGSGVYEADGNLTINNYTHVNGRRVVLLVNGDVTINDSSISIPLNQGLLIIAAKRDITFSESVGEANPATSYAIGGANTFDGYYTAQRNIILDGDLCADGSTSDRRLNIGGALIANSLKPFSSSGTGTIQNRRSLCVDSVTYPSLYVHTRADFLIQMTDFYKTSYSKWKELNP